MTACARPSRSRVHLILEPAVSNNVANGAFSPEHGAGPEIAASSRAAYVGPALSELHEALYRALMTNGLAESEKLGPLWAHLGLAIGAAGSRLVTPPLAEYLEMLLEAHRSGHRWSEGLARTGALIDALKLAADAHVGPGEGVMNEAEPVPQDVRCDASPRG